MATLAAFDNYRRLVVKVGSSLLDRMQPVELNRPTMA